MMVYRVEDTSKHVGPYFSGQGSIQTPDLLQCFRQHNDEAHPVPADDGLDIGRIDLLLFDWRFGFKSMAQLRRWFSEHERELLARAGYRVVVYNVPDDEVRIGHRQVIFTPGNAHIVRTMSPNRLAAA
jgi:hypothetical protein